MDQKGKTVSRIAFFYSYVLTNFTNIAKHNSHKRNKDIFLNNSLPDHWQTQRHTRTLIFKTIWSDDGRYLLSYCFRARCVMISVYFALLVIPTWPVSCFVFGSVSKRELKIQLFLVLGEVGNACIFGTQPIFGTELKLCVCIFNSVFKGSIKSRVQ